MALDKFDECALAAEEIESKSKEFALGLGNIKSLNSISFQKNYYGGKEGEWFFKRTKDRSNLLIESMTHKIKDLWYMTEVTKIDGQEVNKLSDQEISKLLNANSNLKKINIEYIRSDAKNGVYKRGSKQKEIKSVSFDRNYKGLRVVAQPNITSISNINSSTSSFDASIENQLFWDHLGLDIIFGNIYEKLNTQYKIPNTTKKVRGFSCVFTEKQWDDFGLWKPSIKYTNQQTSDFKDLRKKIVINYVNFPDTPESSGAIISMLDKETGSFKVNFDFKSFPFDQQKLTFKYVIDEADNRLIGTLGEHGQVFPYLHEGFLHSSNFENLKFNDWTPSGLADYRYYRQYFNFGGTWGNSIEISFPIERNYRYYILKILLPIIIILLVAWSCFWVSPKELEARLTVSIVCLLSLIAYTFVIDKDLPKLSYLTIMDYGVLLSYAFSTIPTFESIYVKRIALQN